MIVGCPSCRRQYRLDDRRFRPGAKMRCTRCGHLFEASPVAGAVDTAVIPEPAAAPAGTPDPGTTIREQPAPGTAVAPAPARPHGDAGNAPAVLLADAGRAFGATIRPILEALGCRVQVAGDGTTAFRMAVVDRPSLLVVSVHLAGLSGIAICEGVKNSPHLKGIRVAIVGSDLSADLFNRDTALAYGADLFLEESMPEGELRHALERILRPADGGGDPDEIGEALDGLTGFPGTPPGASEDIRRLARIMLADLRLYNPDRFRAALESGRLLEVFRDEIARGRSIVDHRFPDLPSRQDLLATALAEGIERERATQN